MTISGRADLMRRAKSRPLSEGRWISRNIKFGSDGGFDIKPIIDEYGKELIEDNMDEYLELQIGKLWENSLNQKVAAELLKQKQEPFLD